MVYEIFKNKSTPKLAILVDPDKQDVDQLLGLITLAKNSKADFFFIGGSLLIENSFEKTLHILKAETDIPVVIFPGNNYQLSNKADALLFLSLISGRNAEYLIGQHVVAAPILKEAHIEVIPTGYILVDGGKISATSYITQTVPVPFDKPEIAVATAIAGEMLGLKLIYLEAGSGAEQSVSTEMIEQVKKNISVPLIVGGGIRTAEQAEEICNAGADIIVVGNILEKNPEVLMEISLAVHATNKVKG